MGTSKSNGPMVDHDFPIFSLRFDGDLDPFGGSPMTNGPFKLRESPQFQVFT